MNATGLEVIAKLTGGTALNYEGATPGYNAILRYRRTTTDTDRIIKQFGNAWHGYERDGAGAWEFVEAMHTEAAIDWLGRI